MKRFCFVLLSGLAMLSARQAAADLYVLRMGDGTAFTNAGADATPVFIDHFTDLGVAAGTAIALPTTTVGANHPLTLAPASTSVGHMSLSTNGQYLVLGGYDADKDTLTVRQNSTGRTIGRVTLSDATVNTTTSLTDAYPGSTPNNNDIRSVVSTDGTEFWTSGTSFPTIVQGVSNFNAGIHYATLGASTSLRVSGSPTNTRVVNIFNGQLYMSSASGAFQGISTVGTGLPRPTTQDESTTTLLPGFPTASGPSPYDFWFKDANTVYVADDRAPAAGGIQKWTNSGGTWSLAYTLNSGLTTGVRGIDGTLDGSGNAILYGTTGPSTGIASDSIVTVTDTGASSTFATLATTPANEVWRGIVFVPSAGLIGDYNHDGKVNAADYVVWRSNPAGNGGDPAGYNAWRANFGAGGPGAGLGAAAVPEPTSLVLFVLGMVAVGCRTRRS